MNLEDILVNGALYTDEHTGNRYGNSNQLEIVGWSEQYKTTKIHIVKCSICSKDTELYGAGYFKAIKYRLSINQLPCGCSKKHVHTKEQYKILCKRKADELGYKFLGFPHNWDKINTSVSMSCPEHGDWHTSTINMLLNGERGCPQCRTEALRKSLLKPDSEMIASFFASGAFHPDTKFWRSDRKTKTGAKTYWHVYCPECGTQGESLSSGLHKGSKPCACSKHRQKTAYINLIKDVDSVVSVKYGITTNIRRRLPEQNNKSIYEVENYGTWVFDTVRLCKLAERECKSLSGPVLTELEFPDGWSETTYPSNIESIIRIYEQHGGVRVL